MPHEGRKPFIRRHARSLCVIKCGQENNHIVSLAHLMEFDEA